MPRPGENRYAALQQTHTIGRKAIFKHYATY